MKSIRDHYENQGSQGITLFDTILNVKTVCQTIESLEGRADLSVDVESIVDKRLWHVETFQ